MQKKWVIVVDVIVLILVVLVSLGLVWNFSFKEGTPVFEEGCVDVNMVSSFVYEACYDAYSKNIFLEVQRAVDNYKVNALEISFFDFSEQSYKLADVPDVKGAKAYKISAEKNPQNIDVRLNILKDFSAPICDEPRKLFIKYCVARISEGVNVSISPLDGVNVEDFIEVGKLSGQDSDVFALSLIDKERIWKSKCESRWECEAWEPCVDGEQKRECVDVKDCFMPTDMPTTVQYCEDGCFENWECEWSKCINGFTTPKCKELNKCGTSFNVPQKLRCDSGSKCESDIECGEWSSCEVNYNFVDLTAGSINNLAGIKSRICVDKNKCLDLQRETRSCSTNVDIYTKTFVKCGESFVGIYNRLNNNLIARVERRIGENPHLDIYLDGEGESQYCDYCFDGEKNGDEEGVDCGGGCEECSDKYKRVSFNRKSWWGNFIDWIKGMLV